MLRGLIMRYMEIPVRTECSQPYARLETYILDTPADKIRIARRPMVIICPGGGYEKLSYREGEPLAIHFMNQGYHACVLRYSVVPSRYPAALLELGMAMKLIHEHAQDWHVDTDKIILHGASAGGHLVASLGVFWHQKWLGEMLKVAPETLRPAGLMLSYPVITSDAATGHLPSFANLLGDQYEAMLEEMSLEKQVTAETPPCFLWHTAADDTVPVENSLLMAMALRKAGVPVELHVFPDGEHGLSLASKLVERADGSGVQEECQQWIGLADAWLGRLCKGAQ